MNRECNKKCRVLVLAGVSIHQHNNKYYYSHNEHIEKAVFSIY